MGDRVSPQARSRIMSAIRSTGTGPERRVGSVAHRLGYRFRLHRKDLPGNPDLVFPSRKKVIFVHGCFWHQHKSPDCGQGTAPTSNVEFWNRKFAATQRRDSEAQCELSRMGWDVLVVWECETKDEVELASRIRAFLEPASPRHCE